MPADFPKDLSKTALYLRKSRYDVEAEARRGDGETLSKHWKALMEVANRNRPIPRIGLLIPISLSLLAILVLPIGSPFEAR